MRRIGFALGISTLLLIAFPSVLVAQPGPGGPRSGMGPGAQRPGMTPPGQPDPAELERRAEALVQRGAYREAEPLLRRIVGMRRNAVGRDREQLGAALNKLAILLRLLGRYEEAESLSSSMLAMREEQLGPDHPAVAFALGNLGELYRIEGHYKQSEAVLKRSLAIREKALGPDHSQTAESLTALGLLYSSMARFDEAEPLFKRSLVILERVGDNRTLAQTLRRQGDLYIREARYPEADLLLQRSLKLQEQSLGPKNAAIAATLSSFGTLYRLQGRAHEAETVLKRSLAIREESLGPDHPDTAATLANLGFFYLLQYRYAAAKPLLERAVKIREQALGPEHRDVAATLSSLADIHRRLGQVAEAESLYRRSLDIYQKALGADFPAQDLPLRGLAELYIGQRKFTQAEPLLRRSLAIDEKAFGPANKQTALDLMALGNFYRVQGRDAEAEGQYRRSLAISETLLGTAHRGLLNPLRALAVTQGRLRHVPEALQLIRRATAIWRTGLDVAKEHETDNSSAAEQADFRTIFVTHAELAWSAAAAKLGEPRDFWGEAFESAQLAGHTDMSKALAGTAARFAAGSSALARAVREREDAVTAARRLDRALITAAGRPASERDFAGEARLRSQLQAASTVLAKLDSDIRRAFPQYADLTSPQPLTAAATQALLRSDEALLTFLVGRERSWLWVVKRDAFQMLPLEIGGKELADIVAALRSRLDPELNPTLRPYPAGNAYSLYTKLLQPAVALLAGVRQVLIVPDGALQSLPIGVLVSEPPAREPQQFADYRQIAWFARDHAVTVLPSVSSLRALRSLAPAPTDRKAFIGIGNPELGPSGNAIRGAAVANLFRGALADVEKVRELPSLPETAAELRSIAAILGAGDNDLYLGQRATEPLLRKAGLDRYRIVEFATHGLLSGEIEGLGEAALVLTPPREASAENDGLLTASEVATLKLAADWVVLSACNTAIGDAGATGLSGLAQAFFYAGARSLLVSNWAVASEATVKLTTAAFGDLAKEPAIGQAEAMRRAMMAMLSPDNPAEYSHPLVWAPFVVVGEGRTAR